MTEKKKKNYQAYNLDDLQKRNHIELLTDWEYNDPDWESRVIEIKMGDKKSYVSFNQLYSLIFLMANEQEQADMIPTKTGRVRHMEQVITIEAKENVKKGQRINARVKWRVPEEMFVVKKGGTGILVPGK